MILNVEKKSDFLINFDDNLRKYEDLVDDNKSIKVIDNNYVVKLFASPKYFNTELEALLKLRHVKGIPKVIAYSQVKQGIAFQLNNTENSLNTIYDLIDSDKNDILHLSIYFRNDEERFKQNFSNKKSELKKEISEFFFDSDYLIEKVNYTNYIIMERIDGEDLFDYFSLETPSESELKSIAYPLIRIIEQMHLVGIIHKDIKPENIIYNEKKKKVYLIDFEGRTTKDYRAPEVLRNRIQSEKSDMFSVGATLYSLYHYKNPFKYENFDRKVSYGYDCSHEFQDLLESLLDLNPDKRPTASEVLEHAWFF